MTTTTSAPAPPGLDPAALTERIREKSLLVGALLTEIRKVIVGQGGLIERLTIGLLADGHLLLEGVPGLAKTLAVKTLAQAIWLQTTYFPAAGLSLVVCVLYHLIQLVMDSYFVGKLAAVPQPQPGAVDSTPDAAA